MLLHYLKKNRSSEIRVEINKKSSVFIDICDFVVSNSQFIATFNCHAAVCLPDDVQECL